MNSQSGVCVIVSTDVQSGACGYGRRDRDVTCRRVDAADGMTSVDPQLCSAALLQRTQVSCHIALSHLISSHLN